MWGTVIRILAWNGKSLSNINLPPDNALPTRKAYKGTSLMRPSPTGCWTCKLRHRKCDLQTPVCRECSDRSIPCHGYGAKPAWMDGAAAERQELVCIKKAVTRNSQKLRKARKRNSETVREETPIGRMSPSQVPVGSHWASPTQATIGSWSPAQPENAHTRFERDCNSNYVDRSSGSTQNRVENLTSDLHPQDVASSYVFRLESIDLVMHYLDHTFYWQFPYFSPRSDLSNRGWLLRFLISSGPLSHAALALSALHRHALRAPQVWDHHCNRAFEYHAQALRELCEFSRRTETETLLSDRFQLAEFVASSLTLISFEVRIAVSVE